MHQSLGSHRRPWSEEDDAELRRRCEAGEFLIDIARAVGRTQEACRSRANTLGVACRSSLRGQRSRVRQPVPTA